MDELESYSLAEDEDKWITINGSHVKIDENGDVVAGAEGKINSNKNEKKSAGEKLSANEKSAISSYSGDNFLKINSDLRKGKDEDPDVARIDSAIGKQGQQCDHAHGQRLRRNTVQGRPDSFADYEHPERRH